MHYIIQLIILIFSAIVHEVMHGVAAEKLGDDTARLEGRITLNPIPHIDPFGSIALPLFLMMVGSPVILGAAKPVPVNFNNLRDPKRGMALVSLAGPLANFGLAILCVIPIKLGLVNQLSYEILIQAIIINLVLGTFNLIPIPPLDGSKVLAAMAPDRWMYKILEWERFGFLIVFAFLYLGLLDRILWPVVLWFSRIFGLGLY
ncbi:MAG: site-2 protease family protein [Candidatus Doudnabacteria bacterium]|nr:site-2 protease family protein [Candidatus Doudnabacteria bacterium]